MKNDGAVSYELLRALAARAWDEGDDELLKAASSAVDEAMQALLQTRMQEA